VCLYLNKVLPVPQKFNAKDQNRSEAKLRIARTRNIEK
jgi:hypothetical protein